MDILDALYWSDGAGWPAGEALQLCRIRLGDLLRQLYYGPIHQPHGGSLREAIDTYELHIERPEALAALFARCLPGAFEKLGWKQRPPSETWTRDEALSAIAAAYSELEIWITSLPSTPGGPWTENRGRDWLEHRLRGRGGWALERLVDALEPHLENFLSGFLIHGSVGDSTDLTGASDLDTLAILSNRAVQDPDTLDQALRSLAATHIHLLQFNPYMHHSHMLAVRMDFERLSIVSTPPCLFRHGAYWGEACAAGGIVNSGLESMLAFRQFRWFFEEWVTSKAALEDAFEVIWWASSVMLLPVLFAQLRDGVDRWKPDAIIRVLPELSHEECELLEFLTGLRKRLAEVISIPDQAWWADFPAGAHPAGAVECTRALSSRTDWRGLGLDAGRLAQSVTLFRNIRDLAIGHWRRREGAPRTACASSWLRLPKAISLTEFAVPLGRSEYSVATSEVLAWASTVPGVAAVYQFGQVGCPGLSDLDFLFIAEDSSPAVAQIERGIPESVVDIMGHPPLVVSRAAFQDLPLVYPLFSLNRLSGAETAPRLTPITEEAIMPLLVSLLLSKYPLDLICLRASGSIRIKTLASFVHSFVHFHYLVEQIGFHSPEALLETVALDRDLRSGWRERGELDWRRLVDATDLMLEATASLLGLVDAHLPHVHGAPPPVWRNPAAALRFTEEWSTGLFLRDIANSGTPRDSGSLAYPASIGHYIAWLAEADGPASARIGCMFQKPPGAGESASLRRYASYRLALNRFVRAEFLQSRTVTKYIALANLAPPVPLTTDVSGATRLDHLRALKIALKSYRERHGVYPMSSGGWDGLYTEWGRPCAQWIPGLAPEYIAELPRDPRGNSRPNQQYLYRSDGADYKLISHDPDDFSGVQDAVPEMTDPTRPGWAYGFWSTGAEFW